jgi:hypothetical protein
MKKSFCLKSMLIKEAVFVALILLQVNAGDDCADLQILAALGKNQIIKQVKSAKLAHSPETIGDAIASQIAQIKGTLELHGWAVLPISSNHFQAAFTISQNGKRRSVVLDMMTEPLIVRDAVADSIEIVYREEFGELRAVPGLAKTFEQEILDIFERDGME